MTNEHLANAMRLEANANRLLERVKGQSRKIQRLDKHITTLEKQIEGLKWDLDSAHRTIRKLKAEKKDER